MADIKAIKTPDGTTYDLKDVSKQPLIEDLQESGGVYTGGLPDEKLLTTATINKWKAILNIS